MNTNYYLNKRIKSSKYCLYTRKSIERYMYDPFHVANTHENASVIIMTLPTSGSNHLQTAVTLALNCCHCVISAIGTTFYGECINSHAHMS